MVVGDLLFHTFAFLTVFSALAVVLLQNPVYSALFLALTMSFLGIFFFMLHAPFIAAAQVIVYAGAVMVLFVMVVMLFNLKAEKDAIFKLDLTTASKVVAGVLLLVVLSGTSWLAVSQLAPSDQDLGSTVNLSRTLFRNHIFSFEAVSLLLLVAIVGAIALAKSKGGTHAR